MYKKKHFSAAIAGIRQDIIDQGLKVGDRYEVQYSSSFNFEDPEQKGSLITQKSSPLKYTFILSILISDALDQLADDGILYCDEDGYGIKKLPKK